MSRASIVVGRCWLCLESFVGFASSLVKEVGERREDAGLGVRVVEVGRVVEAEVEVIVDMVGTLQELK